VDYQGKTQPSAQTMLQRTVANSDSDIGCMDFPLFIGKNPLLPAPREPSERSVVIVVNVVEEEV